MATQMSGAGGYKSIVFLICAVAALGGLLFGLDQGFIANSLDTLTSHYHLTVSQKENYSAILATGGIIGALLSGIFARVLGRKKSILLAGFIFTLFSAYSAVLPSLAILSACRFALGFAVGIASFVVPLYLSETAPAAIRGSMGTLFQLMITIGIFLISLSNVYIARSVASPDVALPMMFLVIAVFAALMFFGGFILPESPRWLMLQGKRDEAIAVLRRTLNTQAEIDLEVGEIEQVLRGLKSAGFGIVFRGYFFRVLLVGVLLQMFQQLVGINVMIYYAPTIFGYANMKGLVALMAVPTVNMLSTFPAIALVEKWGRKKLLYVGAVVMLVSMIAAGLAFQSIGAHTGAADVGELQKTVLLLAVVIYIVGFAVSWGPVVWLVCSEVFPLEGREVGMTITTMVNWTFAGLVMANALTFMEANGNASIFYLFSVFCVLAIAFVAMFVPETRGITLEAIEFNLKSGVPLKRLGDQAASGSHTQTTS